jgi:hypothetical protein
VVGAYSANAGIRESRGAWIEPLDHDDEWDDDRIEMLMTEGQRTRAELVYGRLRVVNEETGDLSELGAWPPGVGQFASKGAIHHRRLWRSGTSTAGSQEASDWNLARRMWSAGVRLGFVDRVVGTYYDQARHRERSTLERLFGESRERARSREEGFQYWCARAEALEQRPRALEAEGDQPLA